MKLGSLLYILFISINAMGGNTVDTLYKNAFAIKNYENVSLTIDGVDRATYVSESSITVLSAKGNEFLDFYQHVDDFIKLDEVSIKLYDALGKLQDSYSKKDLDKRAISSGLVTDDYIYYKEITSKSFPCTIDISYTVKYKGILNFPRFDVSARGIASKQLNYAITCKKNDINYKLYGTQQKPSISEAESKTYKWSFNNIPALVYEEDADKESSLHAIKVSPRKFSLDGVEGEFSSWEKFGEWYGKLSNKEKELSEKEKQEILALVAGITDKKEKAKIIYSYLQKNFRYVSIQLGIGGFKPISASFTHQKKYGDCKALSNYMQVCLAAANITSYQALINAGENEPPVDESFPINQFNHVILCVPFEKDTVWLECTSNTTEFNKLGTFTENRKALLITESGGRLINTPKTTWQANRFNANTIIDPSLEENNVVLNINCTGEFRDKFLYYINNESVENRLKFLQYGISAKQPDVFNLQINDNNYSFKLHYNKLQEFNAGSKYFYGPSIFPIMDETMPDDDERTLPFLFDHPYQNLDSVTFVLADKYAVETLPEAKTIANKYLEYESKSIENKASKTVQFIHRFTLKNHVVLPADFKEIKQTLALIKEQMEKKFVLKKL